MKKNLFLFLLCASVGFSQTAKTRSALYTEVNTNFADNTGGAITPLILRNTVADMIASAFNPATDGSAAGLSANNTWTGTNGFQAITVTGLTNSGNESISGTLAVAGGINSSTIGLITPLAGAFTTLSANGTTTLAAVNISALLSASAPTAPFAFANTGASLNGPSIGSMMAPNLIDGGVTQLDVGKAGGTDTAARFGLVLGTTGNSYTDTNAVIYLYGESQYNGLYVGHNGNVVVHGQSTLVGNTTVAYSAANGTETIGNTASNGSASLNLNYNGTNYGGIFAGGPTYPYEAGANLVAINNYTATGPIGLYTNSGSGNGFVIQESGNNINVGGFASTGGIGYETANGVGGTIGQGTSRTTAVTLSKLTGAITLFSAAGSATPATFTVNNTTILAGDTIEFSQVSGTNQYHFECTAISAGTSFNVTFYSMVGTATDAPVVNFKIIRGSTT